MPTYNVAPQEAYDLAKAIMLEYEEHQPLITAGVKIDLLFAYGKENKDGTHGDAIKHNGVRALAVAKVIGIKERTLGHGDALITIDGDWWQVNGEPEQKALLDHELYHLELKYDDAGCPETDDAMRPKLKMRKHDHQFGWFNLIAARHGTHSQERIQMRAMCESSGQYLLPGVFKTNSLLAETDVPHNGDTLTTEQKGKIITIPAEDSVTVVAGVERQIEAGE